MKSVLLIHGFPGSGKSTLSARLRGRHGFHVIATDALLAAFIENERPDRDRPDLHHHLGDTWDRIVEREKEEAFYTGFCDLTLRSIHEALRHRERVAVEGYHLKDYFREDLRAKLGDGVRVVEVEVVREYRVGGAARSVEQIVKLAVEGGG